MTEKLLHGEIDAFVCSGVTFPTILKGLGHQYSEVLPAYPLMSSDYYIAFSKNTPVTRIDQWQTNLNSMKLDGTYDALFLKWMH